MLGTPYPVFQLPDVGA